MERYLGILFILVLTFFASLPIWQAKSFWQTPTVLGQSSDSSQVLPINQPVLTQSAFTHQLNEEIETISKKTVYEDDPETEAGVDEVLDEGIDGKRVKIIKITFYKDREYSREIVSTETINAVNKIIKRGAKIVWKTLSTTDGEIKYWKKLRVYATHYDSHCLGCNETTAIGLKQGKGVIAVDPKVIPLRSRVYIPEYGLAIAGDTGGAIKGNIIDLGFDDARLSGWRAKFIDIYLL